MTTSERRQRKAHADGESREPPDDEPNGMVWLGCGFFFLGLLLGCITGFSTATGISQALMTSMFSFVGGVVLTYAGFRQQRSEGDSQTISSRRVGIGLTLLSVGTLTGLAAGMIWRKEPPPNRPACCESQKSTSVPAESSHTLFLHAEAQKFRDLMIKNHSDGLYESAEGRERFRKDINHLLEEKCVPNQKRE